MFGEGKEKGRFNERDIGTTYTSSTHNQTTLNTKARQCLTKALSKLERLGYGWGTEVPQLILYTSTSGQRFLCPTESPEGSHDDRVPPKGHICGFPKGPLKTPKDEIHHRLNFSIIKNKKTTRNTKGKSQSRIYRL